MWDGRESYTTCDPDNTATPVAGAPCGDGRPCAADLTCQAGFCRVTPQCNNPKVRLSVFDLLKEQAKNATLRHAQAEVPGLSDDQQNAIVEFERDLFTAQVSGKGTGDLTDGGANGGPDYLSTVPFFNGINRRYPIGPSFPSVPAPPFTVFKEWANADNPQRAAVARGQALFNDRAGVNPRLGTSRVNGVLLTCAFCHTAPEAGTDSAGTWGNAVTDTIGAFTSGIDDDTPGLRLPRYTVTSKTDPPQTIETTDLGRAAITGRFTDLNKFKTPSLRGLAARAPYFHNGSAATLLDVINAYEAAGFFPPGSNSPREKKPTSSPSSSHCSPRHDNATPSGLPRQRRARARGGPRPPRLAAAQPVRVTTDRGTATLPQTRSARRRQSRARPWLRFVGRVGRRSWARPASASLRFEAHFELAAGIARRVELSAAGRLCRPTRPHSGSEVREQGQLDVQRVALERLRRVRLRGAEVGRLRGVREVVETDAGVDARHDMREVRAGRRPGFAGSVRSLIVQRVQVRDESGLYTWRKMTSDVRSVGRERKGPLEYRRPSSTGWRRSSAAAHT